MACQLLQCQAMLRHAAWLSRACVGLSRMTSTCAGPQFLPYMHTHSVLAVQVVPPPALATVLEDLKQRSSQSATS